MKKILIIIILFAFVQGQKIKAQDPTYSQFYNNKIYLNPAYLGSTSGYRASLSFREQWSRLPGPLHTGNFAFDMPLFIPNNKIGIGLGAMINHDAEGDGFLMNNQILFGASGRVKLFEKELRQKRHEFFWAFGMMGGLNIQSLQWNKLIFADQLDPVNGITAPSSAALGLIDETASIKATLNVGTNFWYQTETAAHSFGYSMNNFFRRQVSLANMDTSLPHRHTLNYTGLFPISKPYKGMKISLVPLILWEHQGGLNTFNTGALGVFGARELRKGNHYSFYGGMTYRSQKFVQDLKSVDALIFHIGFRRFSRFKPDFATNWQFSYSYDMTLSDLRFSVNGAHELSLILTLGKPISKCPQDLRRYYKNYLDKSDWYLLY